MKIPLIPNKAVLKAAFFKYLPIGAAVFFIGLVWHFPYEKALGKLTEGLAHKTGFQIETETLSPALPFGVKGTKVRVSREPDLDLTFDSLRVTLLPFVIFTYPLWRSLSVSYSAVRGPTSWRGSARIGKEDTAVDLDTKAWKTEFDYPLDSLSETLVGTVFKGNLTLAFNASVSGKTAALKKTDLSMASGKISATALNSLLEVPLAGQVRFDKIVVDGELTQGKLNLKSVTLAGPDLTGTISGFVNLSQYTQNSTVEIDAKLTAQPKFREVLTGTGLVSLLEGQLGIRMSPEGVLAFKVTGPLQRPMLLGY